MPFQNVVSLLGVVAWPLTLLVIVGFFRRKLSGLIESVTEARIGSNVLTFGQAKSDKSDRALPETIQAVNTRNSTESPRWENAGNLFWLGHDLMWTMQMALRGAPKDRILHGLKQSNYQLTHLGVNGAANQLRQIISQLDSLAESQLDREWRGKFSDQISSVIDRIGGLAAMHQPDFEKDV
jgi:hypothetical protein